MSSIEYRASSTLNFPKKLQKLTGLKTKTESFKPLNKKIHSTVTNFSREYFKVVYKKQMGNTETKDVIEIVQIVKIHEEGYCSNSVQVISRTEGIGFQSTKLLVISDQSVHSIKADNAVIIHNIPEPINKVVTSNIPASIYTAFHHKHGHIVLGNDFGNYFKLLPAALIMFFSYVYYKQYCTPSYPDIVTLNLKHISGTDDDSTVSSLYEVCGRSSDESTKAIHSHVRSRISSLNEVYGRSSDESKKAIRSHVRSRISTNVKEIITEMKTHVTMPVTDTRLVPGKVSFSTDFKEGTCISPVTLPFKGSLFDRDTFPFSTDFKEGTYVRPITMPITGSHLAPDQFPFSTDFKEGTYIRPVTVPVTGSHLAPDQFPFSTDFKDGTYISPVTVPVMWSHFAPDQFPFSTDFKEGTYIRSVTVPVTGSHLAPDQFPFSTDFKDGTYISPVTVPVMGSHLAPDQFPFSTDFKEGAYISPVTVPIMESLRVRNKSSVFGTALKTPHSSENSREFKSVTNSTQDVGKYRSRKRKVDEQTIFEVGKRDARKIIHATKRKEMQNSAYKRAKYSLEGANDKFEKIYELIRHRKVDLQDCQDEVDGRTRRVTQKPVNCSSILPELGLSTRLTNDDPRQNVSALHSLIFDSEPLESDDIGNCAHTFDELVDFLSCDYIPSDFIRRYMEDLDSSGAYSIDSIRQARYIIGVKTMDNDELQMYILQLSKKIVDTQTSEEQLKPKIRLVTVTAEVFENAMRQSQIYEYELTFSNYFPRKCRMFIAIPVYKGGFINRRDNKDRR